MRTNLIKTNELIHCIQSNLHNPKKLQHYCSQLEDISQYLDHRTKYHYLLFLAEVYSSKLNQFQNGEKICKSLMQDQRQTVELEATLKLAYICALSQKYTYALKTIEKAYELSSTSSELTQILNEFCQRLFTSSKESNILLAIKCEEEQKYDEALRLYEKEFQKEIENRQYENKYYSAKAITEIVETLPNRKYKVNTETCYVYLEELDGEEQVQLEFLEKNFTIQKQYLTRIVELSKRWENKMNKSSLNPNMRVGTNIKRILAIFKIKRVIETKGFELNDHMKEELEACLESMYNNQIQNYSMLNEFTQSEYSIIVQVNLLIEDTLKNNKYDAFQELKYYQSKNDQLTAILTKKDSYANRSNSHSRSNLSPYAHQSYQANTNYLSAYQNNSKSPIVKPTFSESGEEDTNQFEGSYMEKINETSDGYEKRYFYFKKSDIEKGKLKLYYTSKKEKTSSDDLYYDLKKFEKIEQGKKTKAFKRKECENFDKQKCFSIIYDTDKSRNFYVPDQTDFVKWMQTFRKFENTIGKNSQSHSPISHKQSKVENYQSVPQNMSQSKLRKTVFH